MERMTPLRKFVKTLGLNHKNLTNKQMRKWAKTKRYKEFFMQQKIEHIQDKSMNEVNELGHIRHNIIKPIEQRQREFKDKLLSMVYSGAHIKTSPGSMVYSVHAKKHPAKVIGQNKIIFMKRKLTPSGEKLHKSVVNVPREK